MAKQEITLKGLDGQEDHLVYDAANGQVDGSLEECARSLFPQEGETTPRLRFQGFEGEWKRICFGDLYEHCIVKNDLSYGRDKIISVANMYYIQDANVSDDDYLRTYNVFKLGDIAFEGNKSKNFAHGRFVENTIGDGIISHVFEVFRPKSDNYDLMFWKYAINNEMLMGKILSRCTKASTMMTNLVAQDFLKESILVPSLEEQQKIGSFLQRLDAQMALHKQQYERLQQLKSACLNSMFPQPSENTPPIRFKGFDRDWEKIYVSQILTVNSGMDYKNLQPGNIPVYGTGGYMLSVNKSISDKDAIGIGRKGTIDVPQLLRSPFWTIDTLFYMTLKKDCDIEFIFDLCQTIQWKSFDESTGVPSLSKRNIDNIEVKIPTKDEQKVIASFFRSIDSNINTEQQRLERLKQMKSACLRSMFPINGGGNFPLIRFNGFNGEWMMLKIGEIGYTYSSLTGKGKNDFGQGNAQFITFMNVLTNTHIDPTTFQKVVVNEGEMQNPVCKGDLLFNTSSETPEEVGMCSVLDHDIPNLYLNSFCFGYRLTEERVLPSYVVYLMRSTIGRQMMTLLAQGATRYNLPKREFYKAEIPVPPTIEEQKRIASFFRSLDTKISLQTQRIEKLKQMKAACLSKMIA